MSKVCFVCKTEKPLSDFYKDSSRKDGVSYRCKSCGRRASRASYMKHQSDATKRVRRYYESNKDDILQKREEYRKTNNHKVRAQKKARYHVNKAKSCYFCGSTDHLDLHHPDYGQPLFVLTLCRSCHKKWHSIEKNLEPHLSNKSELKKEGVEQLKDIEGFMGFNIDSVGVWYALFDVDSKFWEFLNRDAMTRSIERPLSPVGRYSYRESTKMWEVVSWLLQEHKAYLSSNEKEVNDY